MTEQQASNANFDGWAILEIFGHQRYAGYVTTQAFGTAVMFRVDVPALEERERVAKRPTYVGEKYVPAGSVIKEGPVQGYTKLFGVGAIYAITPCSKEAALEAVEGIQERPLMEVRIPTETAKQLAASGSGNPAPSPDDNDYDDDNESDEEED